MVVYMCTGALPPIVASEAADTAAVVAEAVDLGSTHIPGAHCYNNAIAVAAGIIAVEDIAGFVDCLQEYGFATQWASTKKTAGEEPHKGKLPRALAMLRDAL